MANQEIKPEPIDGDISNETLLKVENNVRINDCRGLDLNVTVKQEPSDSENGKKRVEIFYDPDLNIDIQEFNSHIVMDVEPKAETHEGYDEADNMIFQDDTKEDSQVNEMNPEDFPCGQCEYVAKTIAYLKRHKASKIHIANRYACDQCEYVAADISKLKRHKQSIHDRIRYKCDDCDITYAQLSALKRHKESQHEGMKYLCDQCDYAANEKSRLKKHKASKHEGTRYPCDQCDYAATDNSILKSHKAYMHEGIRYRDIYFLSKINFVHSISFFI